MRFKFSVLLVCLVACLSISLAAQLLGQLSTPSQAAIKAERRIMVQDALTAMDPIDREVLALKHFEQLSTSEIAARLDLPLGTVKGRIRLALNRLASVLFAYRGSRSA